MKMITHNILLHNYQILHRSCFGDPLGLKVLANVLCRTGYKHIVRQLCFKEQRQCLERRESHSSSKMKIYSLTKQFFTKIYLYNRKISFLPWPAQRPDFNMIDNV